jgi:hypothetical protein
MMLPADSSGNSNSLPLFPDSGHDHLMSFLNGQSQNSSFSMSKEEGKGPTARQHSVSSAPDFGNARSISSSVHHHSYDPIILQDRQQNNYAWATRNNLKQKENLIPETMSDAIHAPSSFSSTVEHHCYESKSQSPCNKVRSGKGSHRPEHECMPEIPERGYLSSTRDDDNKQRTKMHHHAYQLPKFQEISSVPSIETYDSPLTTEQNDENRFKPSRVDEKNLYSNMHQRDTSRSDSCPPENITTRPPENITIADELLQNRSGADRQVHRHNQHQHQCQPQYQHQHQHQYQHPHQQHQQHQYQHPSSHSSTPFKIHEMNTSHSRPEQNRGPSSEESPYYSNRSEIYSMNTPSFQTRTTAPCSEATFGSAKRELPGGSRRGIAIDSNESHYRPFVRSCRSSERMQPSDHIRMSNSQQQDHPPLNHDQRASPSQAPTLSSSKVADNASFHDEFEVRKKKRLAIIQEIRDVMERRKDAKLMQDDDECQLLTRHLDLLNEELDSMSMGLANQATDKVQNQSKEEAERTDLPNAAKTGNEKILDFNNIVDKPEFTQNRAPTGTKVDSNRSMMPSDTIKIRAPSDLKTGYEFTATVRGKVVKAIVVSVP